MWRSDDKDRDNWLHFPQWILGYKFYKSPSNSFWLNFVESNFIEHSFKQKFKKLRNAIVVTAGVIVSLSILTATAFIQAQEAIEGRNSTQQELSSVRALGTSLKIEYQLF